MDDSNDFDFQSLYDRMSWKRKAALFLKRNHYLFWKITLMDVVLVVPLAAALVFFLIRCIGLDGRTAFLCSLFVCSFIEAARIKLRRWKTYRYIVEEVEHCDALLSSISEAIRRNGNEEEKRQIEDIEHTLDETRELLSNMSDIVFFEDILDFDEEEDKE